MRRATAGKSEFSGQCERHAMHRTITTTAPAAYRTLIGTVVTHNDILRPLLLLLLTLSSLASPVSDASPRDDCQVGRIYATYPFCDAACAPRVRHVNARSLFLRLSGARSRAHPGAHVHDIAIYTRDSYHISPVPVYTPSTPQRGT